MASAPKFPSIQSPPLRLSAAAVHPNGLSAPVSTVNCGLSSAMMASSFCFTETCRNLSACPKQHIPLYFPYLSTLSFPPPGPAPPASVSMATPMMASLASSNNNNNPHHHPSVINNTSEKLPLFANASSHCGLSSLGSSTIAGNNSSNNNSILDSREKLRLMLQHKISGVEPTTPSTYATSNHSHVVNHAPPLAKQPGDCSIFPPPQPAILSFGGDHLGTPQALLAAIPENNNAGGLLADNQFASHSLQQLSRIAAFMQQADEQQRLAAAESLAHSSVGHFGRHEQVAAQLPTANCDGRPTPQQKNNQIAIVVSPSDATSEKHKMVKSVGSDSGIGSDASIDSSPAKALPVNSVVGLEHFLYFSNSLKLPLSATPTTTNLAKPGSRSNSASPKSVVEEPPAVRGSSFSSSGSSSGYKSPRTSHSILAAMLRGEDFCRGQPGGSGHSSPHTKSGVSLTPSSDMEHDIDVCSMDGSRASKSPMESQPSIRRSSFSMSSILAPIPPKETKFPPFLPQQFHQPQHFASVAEKVQAQVASEQRSHTPPYLLPNLSNFHPFGLQTNFATPAFPAALPPQFKTAELNTNPPPQHVEFPPAYHGAESSAFMPVVQRPVALMANEQRPGGETPSRKNSLSSNPMFVKRKNSHQGIESTIDSVVAQSTQGQLHSPRSSAVHVGNGSQYASSSALHSNSHHLANGWKHQRSSNNSGGGYADEIGEYRPLHIDLSAMATISHPGHSHSGSQHSWATTGSSSTSTSSAASTPGGSSTSYVLAAADPNARCAICEDRASGFHYGCVSCEGCKGFFRRSVQKNIEYSCHKENACLINRITRNRCQACRYRKCVEMGMAREAVRNDRNRKRKIKDEHEEEQRRATEHLRQLSNVVITHHNETMCFSSKLNESPIGIGAFLRQHMADSGMEKIVQFALSIPGFADLNSSDQITLLRCALLEIIILRSAFLLCGKEVCADTELFLGDIFASLSNDDVITCVSRLRDSMMHLQVFNEEVALLSGVSLFCPTRAGLLEPDKVEKLQEPLLEALQIQVLLRRPTQPNVFGKLLMKISDLRSLVLKGAIMGDQARIKEAEECLQKASKYLKTSLIALKFKPDYDSAAAELERAAVCFKNAKDSKRCLDAYLQAADCYEKNNSIFHAAKAKESAALIYKDSGDVDKATELMEEAARLYSETGTSETSAAALEKVAKFFEVTNPLKSIDIYDKAYQTVAEGDKTRQASEYLRRISNLYLRLEKYDEAAANIRREIDLYKDLGEPSKIGKLTACLVLVQLARGDSVAATKDLQTSYRIPGFETTEDAPVIGGLIKSYEDGDNERFQAVLLRPHLRSLDNDYLKLMKKLKAPSTCEANPDDETEEHDEYAGGIC